MSTSDEIIRRELGPEFDPESVTDEMGRKALGVPPAQGDDPVEITKELLASLLCINLPARFFVLSYLKSWDPTAAAQEAYGLTDYVRARDAGWNSLRNPKIARAIQTYFSHYVMEKTEVLKRLSDIARGDVTRFLETDAEGQLALNPLRDPSQTHIIKSVKLDGGRVEVSLHDALRALELLAKHHQLFTEQLNVHVDGTLPITFIEVPGGENDPPSIEPAPDVDQPG